MIRFGEYLVVRNDQGQYSVWPVARPVPPGWRATGERGDRAQCLAHIDEVWTDIRPEPVDHRRTDAAGKSVRPVVR